MRLSDRCSDVYSQSGEDGIIAAIFEAIGTASRRCIEFGAWDGFHLSNTANLWMNGWSGVLIEGVKERYDDLVRNVAGYDCLPLNSFVDIDGEMHLERILERHGVPLEVDLLSIDIDGNDYYVLRSLERLRPRLIICEYNPTLPPHLDLTSPYPNRIGASVSAIERLGRQKGYGVVAVTTSNVFLVRSDLLHKLATCETDLDHIVPRDCLTYVISDYDGNYHILGPMVFGLGRRSSWSLNVAVQRDYRLRRTFRRRLKDIAARVFSGVVALSRGCYRAPVTGGHE